MYDMHYDLLTSIYIELKKNNLNVIREWLKNYNKDNINGLIANLCFMTEEEMNEEYHQKYHDKDVIEIFKDATDICNLWIRRL